MTRIVAHRGARNLWPENSLAGFRNTLSLGVDAVEFDVHLTDAGELVVIHDATLDRTTEAARGPVRALTPEARLAPEARLKGAGEPVPLLAEVLEALAPSSLDLHIEIKLGEGGRPYPGIVRRIAAELARFPARGRVYLTSFDLSVLEDCRAEAPETARLVSVSDDWAARAGGIAAFLERVDSLVEIVAIHKDLMAREWDVISARLPLSRLCVWTINEEAEMREWLGRGVGYLTSDRPDLAVATRASLYGRRSGDMQ